jgi:hypothetical protein
MELEIITLTEEQILELPFPETARQIGGIAVLKEDSLANHLNVEKFRQLWNEQVSKRERAFRAPIISNNDESQTLIDNIDKYVT